MSGTLLPRCPLELLPIKSRQLPFKGAIFYCPGTIKSCHRCCADADPWQPV
jgi:hypothetical protein